MRLLTRLWLGPGVYWKICSVQMQGRIKNYSLLSYQFLLKTLDSYPIVAGWPHSGHYRLTEENFKDFITFLQENNAELSNVKVSQFKDFAFILVVCLSQFKKSNDRSRMSKCLTEEAERYIEDFISNIEDTDISSLDGERSDTSSSIRGLIKPETFTSPPTPRPLPVLMDGVTLPWLHWETSNDASPMTSLNKQLATVTPKTASSTQVLIFWSISSSLKK